MRDKVTHLRPLRQVAPQGTLDPAMMEAVKCFDSGQFMAGVEHLCEAIEILALGDHERISFDRLSHHLRQIRGPEIPPRGAA